MNWEQTCQKWLNFKELDEELRTQLESIQGDAKQLEDAFYKNLEFGTGGMRGVIGPGSNRMNRYTVRKAAEGLAKYILDKGGDAKERGTVIAYDSRHKSPEFAMEAARTLASRGIMAYVFKELRPTPQLSFALRELNAIAGIVITASHNPPEYNGFKVYGEDGAQLNLKEADEVIKKVNMVENELSLEVKDEKELIDCGLIKFLGEEMDQAYVEKLITISENPDLANDSGLRIVYSPLHGTGNKPLRQALNALGYENLHVVEEQEQPDPQFSTVKAPNPEEKEAFELAIRDGQKYDADILIATDPDADRLGVAVKKPNGEYVLLTGNQTGALLIDYILSQKEAKGTIPSNGIIFKTIVTSTLGEKIAGSYGVKVEDVLTGFKFIGEKIEQYHNDGSYRFLFGYEESYGYLIGDFARDKDAIQAAILAVEASAYYKKKGKTLYDVLQSLYEKHGYHAEGLQSLTLKGKEGAEQINALLSEFRRKPMTALNGVQVTVCEDYKEQIKYDFENDAESKLVLPASNVIKYFLEDGSWICLRPSGTEPKVKFYFGVTGEDDGEASKKLNEYQECFMDLVHHTLDAVKQTVK
ncbi:phospho-sugar mutase [Falsibacillus pallidus]|uniref:Phosphoglucomutase n=1 Tax=Falsibacillus pallidus TaxID=493781 RepID=A0A370GW91_9BACI|nr:phospho-sugar mutase [Falsibacillus pallidus]RDI47938.1 phosphoglucomutase [Falsibacillus pallidus]